MRLEMGVMSAPERRVGLLFLTVVALWMSRKWLNTVSGLEGLSDAGVVMAAALLLFVIPSEKGSAARLMDWEDVARLPWGVLILFGGGLALAAQVSGSGLAVWLGESLLPVANLGTLVLIVAAAGLVVFLTELTSNLATTATFLPVIAAIAAQSGIAPLVLCVPVTLAASCAFMLPVATPPNAIVFSSGVLTIPEMVRAGLFHEPCCASGSDAARHACCSSRILVSSGVFKESRARRWRPSPLGLIDLNLLPSAKRTFF